MSRLGKQPIVLPAGVSATFADGVLTVKGSRGELSRSFTKEVTLSVADNAITLAPAKETGTALALWGTYAAHVHNMIAGVTEGFQKKLQVEGVGYRAEMKGDALSVVVGFSHPVLLKIPAGLTVSVEKNVITVAGNDKDAVGQFAAVIRDVKKPEPYKGKGIRYEGEYVLRKQGKRATA